MHDGRLAHLETEKKNPFRDLGKVVLPERFVLDLLRRAATEAPKCRSGYRSH